MQAVFIQYPMKNLLLYFNLDAKSKKPVNSVFIRLSSFYLVSNRENQYQK